MYLQDGVNICKASDGTFLINVRVQKKKKEDKDNKEMSVYSSTEDKILTAKTEDEVFTHLKKILPDISSGYMEEDEFQKAFKEETEKD